MELNVILKYKFEEVRYTHTHTTSKY